MKTSSRGFIALISILVVSALLLVSLISTIGWGIRARENENMSVGAAAAKENLESCTRFVQLFLNKSLGYIGNETFSNNGVICTVGPVTHALRIYKVKISNKSNGAVLVKETTFDGSANFLLVSSVSVPSFPP
jgi:hypothetical protein